MNNDSRSKSHRRATTIQERMKPCQCCGYELSQRHHILTISDFGENGFIVYLCANCHEVYHLIYESKYHWNDPNRNKYRSVILFEHLLKTWGKSDKRLYYLERLALDAIQAKREKINSEQPRRSIWDFTPTELNEIIDLLVIYADVDKVADLFELVSPVAIEEIYRKHESIIQQRRDENAIEFLVGE